MGFPGAEFIAGGPSQSTTRGFGLPYHRFLHLCYWDPYLDAGNSAATGAFDENKAMSWSLSCE